MFDSFDGTIISEEDKKKIWKKKPKALETKIYLVSN